MNINDLRPDEIDALFRDARTQTADAKQLLAQEQAANAAMTHIIVTQEMRIEQLEASVSALQDELNKHQAWREDEPARTSARLDIALSAERALRIEAEQRCAAALAVPAINPAPVFDTGIMAQIVRAELAAPQFTQKKNMRVVVTERDGNGDIRTFLIKQD